MTLLVLSAVQAHAFGDRIDCWPVSKQVATQIVRTPMNEGGVVVVVEESLCGAGDTSPAIAPAEIVPPERRRPPTASERAAALVSGREGVAPLAPPDLVPTIQAVVHSVDDALGRPVSRVVETAGVVRVLAGDAAFLDERVNVDPSGCSWGWSEPWTVDTAQYCIMDQIGGGTFTPRMAFPGWAASVPNEVSASDLPLLDALIGIYTFNGVQPLAFFFLSSPGEPDGRPSRTLSIEVHYPILPPFDPARAIIAPDPERPRRSRRALESNARGRRA